MHLLLLSPQQAVGVLRKSKATGLLLFGFHGCYHSFSYYIEHFCLLTAINL
jgi:hypothetical protein